MTTTIGFIEKVHRPVYGGVVSDCTNNGATATCEHVIVEHPDGEEIVHRGNYKLPVMEIRVRAMAKGPYLHLEPAPGYEIHPNPGDLCGPMAGGNWIEPSPALLAAIAPMTGGDAPLNAGTHNEGQISIHDRYETWAQYDALSR